MGVTHKLTTEVQSFILEQKRSNPRLSCRGLSLLVWDKFQIKLGKSRINWLLRDAGLSSPVGRRRKKKRKKKALTLPAAQPKQKAISVEKITPEQPVAPEAMPPEKAMPPEVAPSEAPAAEAVPEPEAIAPEEAPAGAAASQEPAQEQAIPEKPPPEEAVPDKAIPQEAVPEATSPEQVLPEEVPSEQAPSEEAAPEPETIAPQKPGPEPEVSIPQPPLPQNITPQEPVPAQAVEVPQEFVTGKIILDAASALLGGKPQPGLFKEGLFFKIIFSGGKSFYIDARLHTVWSSPNIPTDFALTVYKLKGYVNRYFKENEPLVLLTAPGYEKITEEFISFLSCWQSEQQYIDSLFIFGEKMEEVLPSLSRAELDSEQRAGVIFGLWPWQARRYRKINRLTEFSPLYFAPLERNFYLAEAEIQLSQPTVNQAITLRGGLLKFESEGEIKLIICTNVHSEKLSPAEMAERYLSCWPNLEEGFLVYSHKIELLTYTGSSRQTFFTQLAAQDVDLIQAGPQRYPELLSAFISRYCLPLEYENTDFPTINERFYSLEYKLEENKDFILIRLITPADFAFSKDLRYLCRRLNERDVILEGKRVWFYS